MKRYMMILTLSAAMAFFFGCTYPDTRVSTVDTRPGIAMSGAPGGSLLYVDGLNMGDASTYRDPNYLRIEPGTHNISITDGTGKKIFEKTIFVESELKIIPVN